MNTILSFRCRLIFLASLCAFYARSVAAQMPSVRVPTPEKTAAPPAAAADDTWWYATLFALVLGLIGAIVWWRSTKKSERSKAAKNSRASDGGENSRNKSSREANALNQIREADRQRNFQKIGERKDQTAFSGDSPFAAPDLSAATSEMAEPSLREKLASIQPRRMPIFSFTEVKPVGTVKDLPFSDDEHLRGAIERASDESEENENTRDLAVQTLSAYKTRNSIEALEQVALYDLSSNVRSKAVSILADFNHESVFATVLLACADPTREVRAAAARGLFHLSFDRADAWARIAETNDRFQMRQAAHAANEADLIKRSFDRLVHDDSKMAYEAFTLTALLLKADETAHIIEALRRHPDEDVKLALLHVVKVVKDETILPALYRLLDAAEVSETVKRKIDETILSFNAAAVAA